VGVKLNCKMEREELGLGWNRGEWNKYLLTDNEFNFLKYNGEYYDIRLLKYRGFEFWNLLI